MEDLEIWKAIQENIFQIVACIATIVTVIKTRSKDAKTLQKKAEKNLSSARKTTQKKKIALTKALEKEATAEEEVKKYVASA